MTGGMTDVALRMKALVPRAARLNLAAPRFNRAAVRFNPVAMRVIPTAAALLRRDDRRIRAAGHVRHVAPRETALEKSKLRLFPKIVSTDPALARLTW